ncbi:MAG: glycosyltransferase family 9 protein [Candidatus Marinimicrobia bacterium]|nr:glycosyltransferase family 9 protein [Candidatus Neomarinimicrobiota bacterium]MDP6726410.1 glycosyltransferase family 9 protein [Candidatus Neomarinimicrobiota bacterium]
MDSPRTILVLRLSSIGDIVQATSPLASLRNRFPNARIDFMTLSHFAPLLENQPSINRIIKINSSEPVMTLRSMGNRLDEDYDLVVDLHNSLRTKIMRRRIVDTETLVYKKPRWKRLKLFQLHINDFVDGFNQRILYHECLKPVLNGQTDIPHTTLSISENEKNQAIKLIKQNGIENDYLIVIPSAAWETKMWSVEGYKSVFTNLLKETDFSIIILGSENDTICDKIDIDDSRVLNLKGKTDLRTSLGIVNNAKAVMGSDTGLVHAAEALGVPGVMIMGPTSVETGGGTFLKNSVTLANEDLWCRPCSQNGKTPCYRKEQYCMTSITPENVINSINSILSV